MSSQITVEFVYDRDCPNIAAARRRLLEAFAGLGLSPRWTEWEQADPAGPTHIRNVGSPAILVDGRDVANESDGTAGNCCRLYPQANGAYQGAPSVDTIALALTAALASTGQGAEENGAAPGPSKAGLGGGLSVLPGLGLVAMPKLFCPACWPAYSGILGSLGLGFVNYTPYLLPLTLLFLAIAVAILAFRAPARHGYGPFALGLVSAPLVLLGKFLYESDAAMFSGIALLIAASIWNAWPRRRASKDCPACDTGNQL